MEVEKFSCRRALLEIRSVHTFFVRDYKIKDKRQNFKILRSFLFFKEGGKICFENYRQGKKKINDLNF